MTLLFELFLFMRLFFFLKSRCYIYVQHNQYCRRRNSETRPQQKNKLRPIEKQQQEPIKQKYKDEPKTPAHKLNRDQNLTSNKETQKQIVVRAKDATTTSTPTSKHWCSQNHNTSQLLASPSKTVLVTSPKRFFLWD